jgi:hypothetical protein
VVADAEGGAADEIDAVLRLLDHRGGRVVPGAGVLRRWRIPDPVVVGAHVVAAGFAARPPGRLKDVDRGQVAAALPGSNTPSRLMDPAGGAQAEHGGERRAAGVRRQAAVGLEGVGEVAVAAAQDLVRFQLIVPHDVPAVLVQVAGAASTLPL